MKNPFAVVSPEELSADEADQLFVEMHSDYPEITREGNTLITGARGCGKSMLIRCSLPDVLMLRKNLKFSDLPYLAVNVSIKKTSLNLQELHRLDKQHVPYLINEHFMALHVAMHTFLMLSHINFSPDEYSPDEYKQFFENTYSRLLKVSGCNQCVDVDYSSANRFFESLYDHLFLQSCEFISYLVGLFNDKNADYTYSLPLLSYTRFLVPVLKKMMNLPGFPNGRPILIFIDDADNLSEIQTEILNSWLASRTQPTISLKVSAQIGLYKTYVTSTGVLVESPHDYQEINISTLYTTSSSGTYYEKAIQILFKRLQLCGYMQDINPNNVGEVTAELVEFFPYYLKQQEGIAREADIIKERYEADGRGYRMNDDIRRYSTPNYIRRLGGLSKSRNTYRYAGLDNIIHISSGIIRYLLDCTAKMFDLASGNKKYVNKDGKVTLISTEIQNRVLREKADFYIFTELKKINSSKIAAAGPRIQITDNPNNVTDKLANLINAMGMTFHEILISGDVDDPFSGRSERKVFSFALSNPEAITDDLKQVLNLGVRLGFLHESYIGNKNGNGRTYLYVLNRCFAPIFTLDPTGFQGYLFMTVADLTNAISRGRELREISKDQDKDENIFQLTMDDFWEE